jgi:hypothetical protein
MDEFTPLEPQPVVLPPEPPADPLPFRRPADYYAAPGPDLRPIFPRWVPMGCGWAGLVFVVLLFAVGAFAPRSGAILDWAFGKIQSDMTPHFTKDVTPVQKAEFNAEMKTLRAAAARRRREDRSRRDGQADCRAAGCESGSEMNAAVSRSRGYAVSQFAVATSCPNWAEGVGEASARTVAPGFSRGFASASNLEARLSGRQKRRWSAFCRPLKRTPNPRSPCFPRLKPGATVLAPALPANFS